MIKRLFLSFGLLVSALCVAAGDFGVNARCEFFSIPVVMGRSFNLSSKIVLNLGKEAAVERLDIVMGRETAKVIDSLSLYLMEGDGGFGSSKTTKVSSFAAGQYLRVAIDSLLPAGKHSLFLTLKPSSKAKMTSMVSVKPIGVVVDGELHAILPDGQCEQRLAVSVRRSGDDGVHSYRIPGIVTAKNGDLLAVYDIRRNSSADLQGDIQIGLSRSRDKGRSWLPMQVAVDMRGYAGAPDDENGVGDPALLIDKKSGDAIIMGLWAHGIKGKASWFNLKQGMTPEEEAAQVVIARSTDNGVTWSKPVNITSQIKDPSWHILLQGPGRGITMEDGTLVFPFQYLDSVRMPHATIVWSRDGGHTWTVGNPARSNTTEAQVVETEPGVLMLNMRDNRGQWRAVMTTSDLGKTWKEHSTNRKALVEPVCMASLIKTKARDNATGTDLLIFSNPADKKYRRNMTIKVSRDGGLTWADEDSLLIDTRESWGYSCLTMIDKNTVGLLYEAGTPELLFMAVPLRDLVKKR